MASEIRANTLKNRVGLGTVSFTNTGPIVSGIITSTGADINGDIDVDGHTNLDNVNIAGVTTSSGNISVVKSSGVANLSLISADNYATIEVGGQSGAFIDLKSPASDDYDIRFVHDGYIYAKTNINLSPNAGYVVNVNKNLNCAENLDVDGHTNLDNVSIVGVATVTGNIIATGAVDTAGITISGSVPVLNFNDTNNNPDFRFLVNSNSFILEDTTNSKERLNISSTGNVGIGSAIPSAKLDIAGNVEIKDSTAQYRFIVSTNSNEAEVSSRASSGAYRNTVLLTNSFIIKNTLTNSPVEKLRITPSAVIGAGGVPIAASASNGVGNAGTFQFYHVNTSGNNAAAGKIQSIATGAFSGSTSTWDADLVFSSVLNSTETERLRITSDGKVGIGTDNPNNPLTIHGSANHIYMKDTATNNVLQIRHASGVAEFNSFDIDGSTRRDFVFNQYASEVLRIASTGNVIIGNSSPVAGKLEVNTGTEVNDATEYYGQDFAINIRANRGESPNNEGNGICFSQKWYSGSSDLVRTGAIIGYKSAGNGGFGGGLIFKTQENGANPMSEKLRINASGRVQIPDGGDLYVVGSSYNAKLNGNILTFDRAGYSYIDQISDSGTLVFRVGSSSANMLRLDTTNAYLPNGTLVLGTQNTSSGHINAYENMSFNIDTDNDDTNRYFSFHANGNSASGTELLRITESGNTRIGVPPTTGSSSLIDEKQATIGTKHFYTVYHNFSSTNSPLAVNSKIPHPACGTVEVVAGWSNGNGLRLSKFHWTSSGSTSGCVQIFTTTANRYGVSVSIGTPTMSISGDYTNFSFTFSDTQGSKMEKLKIHFEYFNQFRIDG